jgi:hypothetical protein
VRAPRCTVVNEYILRGVHHNSFVIIGCELHDCTLVRNRSDHRDQGTTDQSRDTHVVDGAWYRVLFGECTVFVEGLWVGSLKRTMIERM